MWTTSFVASLTRDLSRRWWSLSLYDPLLFSFNSCEERKKMLSQEKLPRLLLFTCATVQKALKQPFVFSMKITKFSLPNKCVVTSENARTWLGLWVKSRLHQMPFLVSCIFPERVSDVSVDVDELPLPCMKIWDGFFSSKFFPLIFFPKSTWFFSFSVSNNVPLGRKIAYFFRRYNGVFY